MCLKILKKVSSQKLIAGIILISAAVAATAYIMENYFKIPACPMCHYERNVFIAAGVFALLSLIFLPSRFHPYALLGLGSIFVGGILLAGYHVAIQHHWVSLPAFCSSNDFTSFDSVESLREQLLKTPFVRCDQVTWSLFGLSLAAYNTILSAFLALLCWGWLWKNK